jgi:hypothetical protein
MAPAPDPDQQTDLVTIAVEAESPVILEQGPRAVGRQFRRKSRGNVSYRFAVLFEGPFYCSCGFSLQRQ